MRTLNETLTEAKVLVGDGENIEYTRGICELIAGLYPQENTDSVDRAADIAYILEIHEQYIKKAFG